MNEIFFISHRQILAKPCQFESIEYPMEWRSKTDDEIWIEKNLVVNWFYQRLIRKFPWGNQWFFENMIDGLNENVDFLGQQLDQVHHGFFFLSLNIQLVNFFDLQFDSSLVI